MSGISNDFLNDHKQFRVRSKNIYGIFAVFAVLVVVIVFWCLKLIGITVTSEALCNFEEHIHTAECYNVECICEFTEQTETTAPEATDITQNSIIENTTEVQEEIITEKAEQISTTEITEESDTIFTHEHNEDCYNKTLICITPEHTHSADCFPDTEADVETVGDWLATFSNVDISNNIGDNVAAIAITQIGYAESTKNFEFDDAGNKNGYTRYGEWYGNPYARWNTIFVSFCINYANINNVDSLQSANAEIMRLAWQDRYAYSPAESFIPQKGDIIFFDTDSDTKADRAGIVLYGGAESIIVIEGDIDNKTEKVIYTDKSVILGYGLCSELYAANYIADATEEASVAIENTTVVSGSVNSFIPESTATQETTTINESASETETYEFTTEETSTEETSTEEAATEEAATEEATTEDETTEDETTEEETTEEETTEEITTEEITTEEVTTEEATTKEVTTEEATTEETATAETTTEEITTEESTTEEATTEEDITEQTTEATTEASNNESQATDNTNPDNYSKKPLLMFSTSSPKANIEQITDLTKAVASVSIKTKSGEILGNDSTVYIGETYIVSLEFSETNTGDSWIQFSHDGDHLLHYQIPEYLHCEPFEDWHPIAAKTENGTIENVGEYIVDETGHLRVRFHDDKDGICFGAKYSNVDFFVEFNATVGDSVSEDNKEIDFGNEIKINLNITNGPAAFTATKTHGNYNSEDHTLDYTIRIEATQGVVQNLVIDDQIWDTHYTLRDTIIVTDLDGNVLDPQPVVSNHPQHNSGAEEGFRISGFPDFYEGEGYLIHYKTQIYDNLLSNENIGAWNGVDVTGNASNGDSLYQWTEDWQNVELEKIKKDGKQTVITDKNGNTLSVIEWEIAIIKNNHNLQGTLIIDTLGTGLSYYTDQSIKVIRYDESGTRLSDVYIDWDDVTVKDNSMEFALPDGYEFDIVYYTVYEEPADGEIKEYHNTVKTTINGKEETAGGAADVIGFIPKVEKTARGDDGEYVYFTIEADIPAVIKDWGNFYLTDMAAFWNYNGQDLPLYVENIPQDISVTAVTKTGQTITFTPYVEGGTIENTFILLAPTKDNLPHSFNILFNTADETFESSKWILNEDAKLTITYKLPFDAKTGTEWSGELTGDLKLEDVLLQGKSLSNEVHLNFTDVINALDGTTYEYAPQIVKKSDVNEDGTIDYKVTFINSIPGSGGDSGYLNSSIAQMWFNDTFDERLEYVPDSLVVTAYAPRQENLWLAKYQYTGTVTGNTIYAEASDMIQIDYNEEADSSGWNFISTAADFREHYHWVDRGGRFEFTYKLRVKDEYMYTTEHSKFIMDNTAELTWSNDGSSGPVTETTEYETGLIDKNVVQQGTDLLFDIHINRRALDILPGSDTLTIEDTMTENLSVYWESIVLQYEDTAGNWIEFNSDESNYSYKVTYDPPQNKLTFIIPDSLHVRIDYTTLITENGEVSVHNAVKINGKAEVSDIIDAVFKVNEHTGGATGSMHSLTLLKQDGATDAPLADAAFHLYGRVVDDNIKPPEGVAPFIVTDKGTYLYYIDTYETGTNGTSLIKTQYLTDGGPYALVEERAPTGYEALTDPVFFYFYANDPDGIIQQVTTLIVIENYKGEYLIPETGGMGVLPSAIIGSALMLSPILYSIIRRKRERRFL